MTQGIQLTADGADPSIHHITRGNTISAGIGKQGSIPAQHIHRFTIEQLRMVVV